ncbi:MAG: 2-oxoglutarate dehydrogenase, E2 component, dihydrolipoamide succinyltransferase [Candidatus Kapaibacterium sp.]|jgi:2-oxoglutarate dehydrogenase E2 component (dihydrolipoamide succinyltransferase)|nr:2-oxoglutarate dehydrogenase, E2 component, dihydrolipoamide succinyltransferase [Candidatus Kapabacteria bacterium]
MKIEVVMPKMGESLQEGTITKWLKKEGDVIERDEMILEISTDKVDTEVPSPNAGVLVKILVNEQETVEVGTAIAIIETDASAANVADTKKPEPAPAPAPEVQTSAPVATSSTPVVSSGSAVDVVMPKMGESLQEGTVIKWLKKVGDKIERDEMILEISTDKVDTEVPSPVSGTLSEIIANEGDTVEVGVVIARIATGNVQVQTAADLPASQASSAPVASQPSAPAAPATSNEVVVPVQGGTIEIPTRKDDKFFSPLVRTMAKEHGVTLEELMQIKGSGVQNRVTKDDLNNYLNSRTAKPATQAAPAAKAAAKPASVPATPKAPSYPVASGDDVEIIPMDRIRQLISEHMVYSKHTSAHVTSVAEVDVTNIVNFRNKHKDAFQKQEGFKLTYTPFFAKAAVDAIRQFPMVNVSVDGKNILRHKRINLGIATALPDGNLIVPVIKSSEVLNITGLARSVNDLASRARNKKLLPDEIQGGTFTLTNVGTFGTLFGTPVINQPQCGIFGVGAIKKRPMVKEVEGNDLILVRHMMYCSITYDHRVIDGMLAGQTLAAFVKSLENMNENTITL